jgi:hypothetical protein
MILHCLPPVLARLIFVLLLLQPKLTLTYQLISRKQLYEWSYSYVVYRRSDMTSSEDQAN